MIQAIKQALQGYHGEIKGDVREHVHYSELIRRLAPGWLADLLQEREYIVEQLKRINGCVIPGLANHIASETLERIGEVERNAELYSLNGRADKDAPETRASV
jgi:hypothetical protein